MLLPPKYKCTQQQHQKQYGVAAGDALSLALPAENRMAQQQCQHRTIQKTNMTGWIQKLYNQLESRALHTNRFIPFNTVMMYLFPRYVHRMLRSGCQCSVFLFFSCFLCAGRIVIFAHGTSSIRFFFFHQSDLLLLCFEEKNECWMDKSGKFGTEDNQLNES